MKQIKTIIFDFGAVLLDISLQHAIEAFSQLSGKPVAVLSESIYETDLFNAHEKGQLSNTDFLNRLSAQLGVEVPHQVLIDHWNKVLVDLPKERLEMVQSLRENYRVLLLSNTNAIHVAQFDGMVNQHGFEGGMHAMFDKVYYSNEIGMRKPDPAIFEYVVEQENIDLSEMLFVDDNEANCKTCRALGWQVEQMKPNSGDFSFFADYGIQY